MLTTYDLHLEGSEVIFPKTFGEFETVAKKLSPPELHSYIFVTWLYLTHDGMYDKKRDEIWNKMLRDVKETND